MDCNIRRDDVTIASEFCNRIIEAIDDPETLSQVAPLIEDAQTASLLWTTGVDYLQGDFIQQAGQDMSFDFHAATA